MITNRKRIFFWLKIVIIMYCGGGIALYYLQDTFLFHPKSLPPAHEFNFKTAFTEFRIPVNKTDTISMIKFFPKQGTLKRGLVIYFHGNMENAEYYGSFTNEFTKYGYEVWMPDYPGYGKTTGERNEKKMYDHAWLVQKLAMNNYRSDSIIIYGKSLGTGIAAYTASISKCRLLVLETPYYSITDLFAHYAWMYPVSLMVKYKIPTWQFLEDVKAPVIIFHGTDDKIIPYSCAEKLKKSMKAGDRFVTIENAKHNDIADYDVYKKIMDSLLSR